MLNPLVPREEITVTDNGKTVYDYGFKIYADTDIIAYATAAGAEPNDSTDSVVISAVTGVGEASGGTITIPAMDANTLLTIVSNIPTDRDVSYVTNGDFIPETVDNDFDKTLSIVKQIDATRRGLKFADAAQGVDDVMMDTPVGGQWLRWNSAGDALINSPDNPGGGGGVETVAGAAGIVDNTDPANPIINGLASVTGDRVDGSTPSTPVIKSTIIVGEENGSSTFANYYLDAIGTDRDLPTSLEDLDGVMCVFDASSNPGAATLRITGVMLDSSYPIADSGGTALSGDEMKGGTIVRFDNTSGGRWLLISSAEGQLPEDSVDFLQLTPAANAGVAKAYGHIDPSDTSGASDTSTHNVDSIGHESTTKNTIVLQEGMNTTGYIVLVSGIDGTMPKKCGAKIITSSTFEVYNESGTDSLHFVVYGFL